MVWKQLNNWSQVFLVINNIYFRKIIIIIIFNNNVNNNTNVIQLIIKDSDGYWDIYMCTAIIIFLNYIKKINIIINNMIFFTNI